MLMVVAKDVENECFKFPAPRFKQREMLHVCSMLVVPNSFTPPEVADKSTADTKELVEKASSRCIHNGASRASRMGPKRAS